MRSQPLRGLYCDNDDLGPALEIGVQGENIVQTVGGHSHALVLAHLLLKEVRLSVQRDHLHEVKGVLGIVDFANAQLHQQSVRHEFNVLRHKIAVHADEVYGQGIG